MADPIKGDVFVTNWDALIKRLKQLISEIPQKPDNTKTILQSLSDNFAEVIAALDRLYDVVDKIPKTQVGFVSRGTGAGFPPNMDNWDIRGVTVSTINTGQSLPLFFIPSGFTLVVRARNANTGNVFVSNSIANVESGINRVTLAAGEFVRIGISRTDRVFIAVSVANDGVEYFWEK